MNLVDELSLMDAGVYSPQEIDDLCERAAKRIRALEAALREADSTIAHAGRLDCGANPSLTEAMEKYARARVRAGRDNTAEDNGRIAG